MNAQTMSWSRRSLVLVCSVLAGCLMIFGCGSEQVDPAERIQAGVDFLYALAGSHFDAGWSGRDSGYIGGGAQWADETISWIDDDRLPDWASDEYEMCIYWERALSYKAVNQDRKPGEPVQYTFEGKFWGWILVNEEDVHVLELGIEFDGQSHLFVNQWVSQPNSG